MVDGQTRGHLLWAIAVVVLAALGLWALYLARQAILLVYVSGLLATGFAPLVRTIERRAPKAVGARVPRWMAILVIYVLILTVVAAIGVVVLPPLVEQAEQFWKALPGLFQRGQQFLVARGALRKTLTVGELVQQAQAPTDVVGTVLLTFWGVIGGLFGLFTLLILTFYLLVESDELFTVFVRLFPAERRQRVRAMAAEVTTKVSAWLTGQLILSGVIGISTAIVLGLLGVPYFYVLATISAVGELIPYVGPLLGSVPGVAVGFSMSPRMGVGLAIFFFVQQQLESQLLVPKVMERQVGLSAVAVIVALLLGGSLLGVVGAVLAVPTAAIVQVILQAVLPDGDAPATR